MQANDVVLPAWFRFGHIAAAGSEGSFVIVQSVYSYYTYILVRTSKQENRSFFFLLPLPLTALNTAVCVVVATTTEL